MKKYWQSLSSQERRVVAVVGLIVFILLNLWFIKPHFHDFQEATIRIENSRRTNAMYRAEMEKKPQYEARIKTLMAEAQEVPPENTAITFVRDYQGKITENGLVMQNNGRVTFHTNNQFFIEADVGVTVQGTEKQLVNFLYSLGAGSSLMRVKGMSLRPDQSHQQLIAGLTIVGSYQRSQVAKTVAPSKTAAAPPPTDKAKPAIPTNKPAAAKPITNNPAQPNSKPSTGTNKSTIGIKPPSTNKPASSTPKKP